MTCCISGCEVTTLHPSYKFCSRHWREYAHYFRNKNVPQWLKFLISDTGRVSRRAAKARFIEVPYDEVFPEGDRDDSFD